MVLVSRHSNKNANKDKHIHMQEEELRGGRMSHTNLGEFYTTLLAKELIPEYVKNSQTSDGKKKKKGNLTLKIGVNIKYFTKGSICVGNKHMKICATQLVIREVQVETTMSYHLVFIIMAGMKSTWNVLLLLAGM